MKVSANLSLLFTGLPIIRRPQAAAAAGFDGVEIQFPYELPALQLNTALERAGMPLVLINMPAADLMQGGAGLAAAPASREHFKSALDEALRYAAVVQPACINVLAGRLPVGCSRPEALSTLEANLRLAAQAFDALGIKVLCEAINPLDMPGFLINTPEQLDELLRRVDHPNCLAQLDLYHLARQGVDIEAGITLLNGRIGHVQFADCPGRGAPGSGRMDFFAALKTLAAGGYSGWFGAEFNAPTVFPEDCRWLPVWRAEWVRFMAGVADWRTP
jgi:hydroxypyruvate isomerase